MKTTPFPLRSVQALLAVLLFAPVPASESSAPLLSERGSKSPERVVAGLATSDWESICAAYEAGRHAFEPTGTGWQAHNPGQQWTITLDRRGFLAQPREGGWQWGLELQSYGWGEPRRAIRGIPAVTAEGQRLSYQWDATVLEWFVNDQRGLEHGFTVKERPSDSLHAEQATLSLTCAVRGGLRPVVDPNGQGLRFVNAEGGAVVTYSGLKVWDADGRELAARLELAESETAQAQSSMINLRVNDCGARYPLTIDPIGQQAYLKASNTGADDWFGWSVAVSGDTVVVGAPNEDSNATGVGGSQSNNSATGSGAAYVFVRNGTIWHQEAYLKASNTEGYDNFGYSVAVSGDTVVVGAYHEDGGATGVNPAPVGYALDAGAAYVFVRSGTSWSQEAYLKASNTDTGDEFGRSVAVSGDTVVVGAWGEDSWATGVNGDQTINSMLSSGAAYVFVRGDTGWHQEAYLKASNTFAGDYFGYSVAVSGDTVVVGAYAEDSKATGVGGDQTDNSAVTSGAAYVFVRTGVIWSQQAYLKASNTGAYDHFGWSVAVSDNTVVVGADGEDSSATGVGGDQSDNSASDSGAAYVFVRSGAIWSQQAYLKASNTGASDYFGQSVAVSDNAVVIGAFAEDSNATVINGDGGNNSAAHAGAAYVFVRSGAIWSQQAYLKASNTGASDQFGYSVAVSGDTVVVGAYSESSNATGVGGSQSNNSAFGAGAAYVFIGAGPVNAPPMAPEQTFTRASNLELKIRIADLLAACSDPDGGTPALDSVGASTEGATISLTATHIHYSLAGNASDSFSYTISDGQGGTATGTVMVQVANPGGLVQSITTGEGAVTMNFGGIPTFTYAIQRASDPLGPWVTVYTQTAPANGLFSYTDPSPPPVMAFYRLLEHVSP